MVGVHAAVVLTPGKAVKPRSHRSVAAHEIGLLHPLQLADGADSVLRECRRERLADAPDQRHRLVGEKSERLSFADHREAARFVEVGRDLGEELAVGEPHRNGDADLGFHRRRETRQYPGRRLAMKLLGPREVEECLVDGDRLDQWRQREHHLANLPANADIFLHVRLDHHGVRAGVQRLEHRHRRAHAADAGDVACGRHHAALAAADDHRPVAQGGVVALLDRRIERVAVDVSERQGIKLRVAQQARAAARLASPRNSRLSRQAIAAETELGVVDSHRPK